MNLSEKKLGDAVVVAATGRIDLANSDAFRDRLSEVQAGAKALICDFSGVEYISSAGLRVLMIVFKKGKAEGKAFAVAALAPLVKEIFTISRFDLVFPLFDTVRDALQKQAPGALAAFDKG
jgi:anti-sigma B factor antagonist